MLKRHFFCKAVKFKVGLMDVINNCPINFLRWLMSIKTWSLTLPTTNFKAFFYFKHQSEFNAQLIKINKK